jgi:hypothetical protein
MKTALSSQDGSLGEQSHNATSETLKTAIVVAGENSNNLGNRIIWDITRFTELYPNISKGVIEKVIEGYQCLLEIYFMYGLNRPKPSSSQIKSIIYCNKLATIITSSISVCLNYLSKYGELEWVAFFKYKTCAFYAYYETEKTDLLPPIPGMEEDLPHVLFGGLILKWQTLLFQKNYKKFLGLLVSINQAKMGMPRPGQDFVDRAVRKTEKHLTTEPPIESFIFSESLGLGLEGEMVELSPDTIKEQLRRIVREMFEAVVYTTDDHYEPFFPSTSSNYNKTISKAGCVGELYEQFLAMRQSNEAIIETNVIDMDLSHQQSVKYGLEGQDEQEKFDCDLNNEEVRKGIVYDATEFRVRWRKLMDDLLPKAIDERPLCKAIGLSEALKARVISKGPPLKYTYLKPLQIFLWKALKKNSVFHLIGQPVKLEMIQELFGHMTNDDIIINGDYKASTDNLHSWVSEALADELVLTLNENARNHPKGFVITPDHHQMIIDCLTRHQFEIQLPDGSVEIWSQKEGQLMGSIISFPFLCMANAAFCRWALELSNRTKYRLRDRWFSDYPLAPLKVNGDDCTMKGSRNSKVPESHGGSFGLQHMWTRITARGGLQTSIGKTLFSLPHRPVVMINSLVFDYNDGTWVERKYIPMGLLMGKQRSVVVGCQKDKKDFSELGAVHRDLLKMSPDDMKEIAHERFLYYNSNILREFPNIPWFMPEYLGGPGLVPLKENSSYDRRLATILIMNKGKNGDLIKALSVRKPNPDVSWQIHDIVIDRLKKIGVEEQPFLKGRIDQEIDLFDDLVTFDLEDNFSRLYKYLTIETLFTQKLENIFDPEPLSTLKHRNVRNDIAWANARHYADSERFLDVQVRTDEELKSEKKLSFYPCVPLEDTNLVY